MSKKFQAPEQPYLFGRETPAAAVVKTNPAPPAASPRDTISYQGQSQTSRAGAIFASRYSDSQESQYLTLLHKAGRVRVEAGEVFGGLTDREAAELLGWERNIVNARRGSKHGRQYAKDSGHKRDGGRGVDVVVWVHALHI